MASYPELAKKWWQEHSQSCCRLIEVFLAFGCGIFTIVSFGSPFWVDQVGDNKDTHKGLWQQCGGTPTKCQSLNNVSSTVIAVRALMCLALICTLIGWALSMVALVIHKPRFLFSAGMAFLLQTLWLFIGLLSYTKEINSLGGKHAWSYSIGWLGFFVAFGSTIYYLLIAIYRYRHPDSGINRIQQIYAPLTQWDDVSSSDSDDNNL